MEKILIYAKAVNGLSVHSFAYSQTCCLVSTTFANPAIKANMLSDNITEKRLQTGYNGEKNKGGHENVCYKN